MFFGPVFPTLVLLAMKVDPRFARAVRCSVVADRDNRDDPTCEPYELPVRLLNALLVAVAVVALAAAAELIFAQTGVFLLTGVLALAAVAWEAAIFSYVMTEATIFAIYAVLALCNVLAWRTLRMRYFVLSGLLLGLLCLTKPSFLVLFPLGLALTGPYFYCLPQRPAHRLRPLLAFSLAFAVVVGGWVVRNAVSVGKIGFTEEYGAAALIERFAFNDMTAREYFQAFPYCTPGFGELVFDQSAAGSMHRFTYYTPGSFFNVGRDRRNALLARYGRLDPEISGIVADELRANWWRHLLISLPLAWCGMWPGWIASLLLVPLFAWAFFYCVRNRKPLFPLYALPPLANLALVGLVGNQSTRYNLILIGPYAIGTAFMMARWLESGRWRWRFPASGLLSAPSAIAVSDEDSTSATG